MVVLLLEHYCLHAWRSNSKLVSIWKRGHYLLAERLFGPFTSDASLEYPFANHAQGCTQNDISARSVSLLLRHPRKLSIGLIAITLAYQVLGTVIVLLIQVFVLLLVGCNSEHAKQSVCIPVRAYSQKRKHIAVPAGGVPVPPGTTVRNLRDGTELS